MNAVKSELCRNNLALKNLLAIGTDNASVMIGVNNGEYKKLKSEIPSLILIKCTCHSLQLAISLSCIIRKSALKFRFPHKWFSFSATRQVAYSNLYQAINDDKKPLKISMNCKTRWLSMETAVERIISQWIELKTHFQVTRTREKCYTSEVLCDMYCDETTLHFCYFYTQYYKRYKG